MKGHEQLARRIVLGLLVAAFGAPTALAADRPDDHAYNTPQGLKADGLRLQGIAQMYQQLQLGPTEQGMKAEGLRLRGIAQAYQQVEANANPVDRIIAQETGRSHDPRLFGVPAATTIQIYEPGGFHWGDAGIGAGTAAGLMLLALGATLVVRGNRVRSA